MGHEVNVCFIQLQDAIKHERGILFKTALIMKNIWLFCLVAICLGGHSLRAQIKNDDMFSLLYSVGIPMGDLSDYIQEMSWRGASMEYRHMISDKIAVGLDLAWNTFYETVPADSYTISTLTLSGKQYRYQNSLPMLISADYFFATDASKFRPFVGLGAGTIYNRRDTDMGLYRLREDAWQFGLNGEAGLITFFSSYTGFKLAVDYYMGFAGGDLDADQTNFAVGAGLIWQW